MNNISFDEPIMDYLAESVGSSFEEFRQDPLDPDTSRRIYNSIMKREGAVKVISPRLFDEILTDVVKDDNFLFNPADFGQSDHYSLTNYMTSRLNSKFMTFNPWISHDSFPEDIEIISFPSSQPYAYVKEFEGKHIIVIHYGLTQLLEFTAETDLLQHWIGELKKTSKSFTSVLPFIEKKIEQFFIYKMALGNYVQQKPLLLPGFATILPLPYLLKLISRVAFSELFICAHEHVHITEKHFGRINPDANSYHSSLDNEPSKLSDDQKLELATDLMALPYFSPKGWTSALDGIATYFQSLGQYNIMHSSPSRSHPPISHRIDNLLSETVAIGSASMMPVRLYQVKKILEQIHEQENTYKSLEESADWSTLISDYTNFANQLGQLLLMSEISNQQ